jgi:hypothetical protein
MSMRASKAPKEEQIAEQAIQIEELQEQDQVQAAAFRAAQTQLPQPFGQLPGLVTTAPMAKTKATAKTAGATGAQPGPECLFGALGEVGKGRVPVQGASHR